MPEFITENRLYLLLALGTAFTCFGILRYQDKLRIKWWAALPLSLAHTLIGVLCVKVFAALESWDFSGFSNMSLFGAVFFLPLFYFAGAKLTRRSPALVFDAFTPCVIFVLLCTRINCMLAGCCQGAAIPGASGHYPTREAEILFYIGALLSLIYLDTKNIQPGKYYPLYMIAYGIFRFICQFFRGDGGLALSHLWAVLAVAIGLVVLKLENNHRKRDASIENP